MHCQLAGTCSVSAGRNPDGHMLTAAHSQVNAKGYATRQEGFAALLFTLVLLAFPTQLFTLHPLRARVANTLRGRFPAQHTNRLGLLAHSASSRLLPMRSLEAILFRTSTQVNATSFSLAFRRGLHYVFLDGRSAPPTRDALVRPSEDHCAQLLA